MITKDVLTVMNRIGGSGEFTNLKYGDLIYYKNNNLTDIRRLLPAKFIKRISTNILQVSLGGRVVSAHKRQLKFVPNSRRKATRTFVFHGENTHSSEEQIDQQAHTQPPMQHDRKRKREDDDEELSNLSDSSSDFYRFASEPFIVSGKEGNPATHLQSNNPTDGVRRSKRIIKKKKKEDFEYY